MCIFFQILFYLRKFRYAPCHFFLFLSMGSELDQLEIINYMHRALSDQKDYVWVNYVINHIVYYMSKGSYLLHHWLHE